MEEKIVAQVSFSSVYVLLHLDISASAFYLPIQDWYLDFSLF